MTTYEAYDAYDAGLPCKNPSCKSYGAPHPNCRCYGGSMAEGGEVEHFCSEDRKHNEDCEYYAEGGDVPTWDETKPVTGPEPTPTPLPTPEEEPTWDNTKEVSSEPTWENTSGKYETPLQQIGTAAEGFAQGIAGPLATGAELGLSKLGVPGLSAEDIKGREEANPAIHGASEAAGLTTGLLTGTGEAGLALKAASKATELAKLSEPLTLAAKVGSGVIQGAIQNGLFQAGDEVTKAMLGQGDPTAPVSSALADAGANILFSSVLGAGAGGVTSGAGAKLTELAESKLGTKLHSFLSGLGEAANDQQEQVGFGGNQKAYDAGVNWFKNNISSLAISGGLGTKAVYDISKSIDEGDPYHGIEKAAKDIGIGMGLTYGIRKFSPAVGAALLKAISNGESSPAALFKTMDYAAQVANGNKAINKAIDGLFKTGSQQYAEKGNRDRMKDKLDSFIENGGIDAQLQQSQYDAAAQGYAQGGKVNSPDNPPGIEHNETLATHYPEQNVLLNTARGRVSNYLKALRPQEQMSTLPFDSPKDMKQQKRSYDRALDIAVQPLSIMNHVQKGTIESEHVNHLNSLYPEVSDALKKKVTERLIKAQLKGEKPPYHVRQSLSMLVGTPLSSELTTSGLQAIQNTFQQNQTAQQQPQPVTKNKKNTSTLSKVDDHYLTSSQARVERQQKV